MGLGAVWLGAPLMAKKEIETLLNVPADRSLVCLVPVGHPAESPQKDRKPVDEVLEFIHLWESPPARAGLSFVRNHLIPTLCSMLCALCWYCRPSPDDVQKDLNLLLHLFRGITS